MTQINLEIKMLVEGYREISQKKLAETNEYYVQLQTSFISDNGDLEQMQVKVMKAIDFKSLVGKVVLFKNVTETVIGFDKFYKADDIEIINDKMEGIKITKSMIMDVIAVSDKISTDQKTKKETTNGFLFAKDTVDGAIVTYKVKVKNTNKNVLAQLNGKKIKINNLAIFKPQDGFKIYYSVDSTKEITSIK
jgi:hypothetical protein